MSAKTQIVEHMTANPIFKAKDAAEALGLNISTVRKAISELVNDGTLCRENDSLSKPKVTRVHKKKTIGAFIAPIFAAALDGVNIHDKRACKTALESVTLAKVDDGVKELKPYSKFSQSHLDWYKSQYLRGARKADPETPEQTAERVASTTDAVMAVAAETQEAHNSETQEVHDSETQGIREMCDTTLASVTIPEDACDA